MIKFVHLFFVLLSFFSFTTRVILSVSSPEPLKRKWLKITPHVIDTLLLFSGVTLVVQGHWLNNNHDWLVAKIMALLGYIGFGIVTMRRQGPTRWVSFAAAMGCFFYIFMVAVSKKPAVFL